jgi:chromosomal replication initiator protein
VTHVSKHRDSGEATHVVAGKPQLSRLEPQADTPSLTAPAALPPSPLPSFDDPTEAAWASIVEQMRYEFGRQTFDHWLKPLRFLGVDNGTALLAMPTSFMADWVRRQYADRLRTLWASRLPHVRDVRLLVAPEDAGKPTVLDADAPGLANTAPMATKAAVLHEGSASDSDVGAPLDPRYTFDSFVVGKSNEFAYSAAQRVAEGTTVTFNPLFLYSGVGLGKTHLMHAIAWEIRRKHPGRKVVYLSAEQFMVEFVAALRHKDTVAFKQRFRNVDVLMIDDVQFIAGKDVTQDEFFHTFNALIDYRRQLVISADRSPNDLEGIEDRIKSRLSWGLVADIHATDFELRLGILQNKLDSLPGVKIDHDVLELLARRISSNVRDLQGALNRLAAHATLVGRTITVEFAKEVLQDVLRANDRRITIDQIQRATAEYYKLRLQDLHSARRAREVARPRQVAMYLCKRLTPRSLPEIGRKFGGRDHTTVMHAIKRIEELRQTDSDLDRDVTNLFRLLEG